MKTYSVYRHIFPNGKSYIGITSQAPEKRFAGGRGYRQCPKVYAAILKYGWNNVEHELLMTGLSKPEAEQAEIEKIAFYNSIENGYNIEHGGNVPGTHNIETRQKISAGNKGKEKPPATEERKQRLSDLNAGEGNPFYGRHHTVETRAAHSEFMKGNQYNKGNHHTEAFKAWKSEQMKAKYADGSPRSREVIRTDLNGNETRYRSLRQAAQELGKSASALCEAIKAQGEYCGYNWRYANEA